MSINKKLTIFITTLLIVPMVVILIVSSYINGRTIQNAQISYLHSMMQSVQGEMQERKSAMAHACGLLADTRNLQLAVRNDDKNYLQDKLDDLKHNYNYIDYAVIVDKNNSLLTKLTGNRFSDKTFLRTLTGLSMKERQVLYSFEVLPLDELFSKNSPEYEKFLVKKADVKAGEDPYIRKGLTSVVIVPIYDREQKDEILGAIIVCDVWNNDSYFPNYVSANANGALLVANIDGTRVAASLANDKNGTIIGTKSAAQKTMLGGTDTHIGEVDLNDIQYLFLNEDLLNSAQEPVATLGVGISKDSYYHVVADNRIVIIVIAAICFLIMLFYGRSISKRISKPIMDITRLADDYSKEHFGNALSRVDSSDEYVVLAQSIREFIQRLEKNEVDRKQYLSQMQRDFKKQKDLTEELKQEKNGLELKVEERTTYLKEAVSQLEEANKAKMSFLANLSHELRTPLNVIIGSVEVMQEGISGKLNEKQSVYAESIHSSGTYLLKLINDLLDLSKMNSGMMKIEPIDFYVRDIVDTSVRNIEKYSVSKKLDIQCTVTPTDILMHADPDRLQQILYNLLSNAVKFTDEGGTITVTVKQVGQQVQFIVKDTGIGIDAKDISRVFQEFEQVDNPYTKKSSGTGLGLPIVKKIVELHGGSVQMESEAGKGTTVTVILPLHVDGPV